MLNATTRADVFQLTAKIASAVRAYGCAYTGPPPWADVAADARQLVALLPADHKARGVLLGRLQTDPPWPMSVPKVIGDLANEFRPACRQHTLQSVSAGVNRCTTCLLNFKLDYRNEN